MTIETKTFPKSDPKEVNAFYREPLKRQKRNKEWREVLHMAFESVDLKELEAVQASSRERGVYEREAKVFMATGEAAGKVSFTEGAFKGKVYASVLQGFRSLAKKDEWAERIRVIGQTEEENVYLLNLEVS